MKVWITKYALTKGIYEVIGELEEGYFKFNTNYGLICFPSDQFALTHEMAIQKAEKMRADKIERLQKSITKLEKLSFRKAGKDL